MNQVKTYIDRSEIEGIGMFAAEFIAKDTLIWKFSGLDQKLTKEQVDDMRLTELEMSYFLRYEFGVDSDEFYFCCDDAKYCNHSILSNSYGYPEQYASIDIQIGEEITCDYRLINKDFDEKEFEILKSNKNK